MPDESKPDPKPTNGNGGNGGAGNGGNLSSPPKAGPAAAAPASPPPPALAAEIPVNIAPMASARPAGAAQTGHSPLDPNRQLPGVNAPDAATALAMFVQALQPLQTYAKAHTPVRTEGLDEAKIPGGHYIVGGRHVDAFGETIDDKVLAEHGVEQAIR